MGWEDRPYHQDDSRPVGGTFTPTFGPTLPLFRGFGVRVRAHYTLPLFAAFIFAVGWSHPRFTLADRIIGLLALTAMVVLHEFGHCLAARAVGGTPGDVILWPLGGLGNWDVPRRVGAAVLTALGGLLANLTTCVTCGAVVWFLSEKRVSFNPFHPLPPDVINSPLKPSLYAWWLFVASYCLLLINLLPILPLDGGHVLQALLRPKLGSYRSAQGAVLVGMAGSGILMIVGISRSFNFLLILLGAVLFVYCTRKRLALKEAVEGNVGLEDEDAAAGVHRDVEERPKRRHVGRWTAARLRRQARREAEELDQIDAILAKVSAHGLRSLTWRERRALRRATRRRREMELAEK